MTHEQFPPPDIDPEEHKRNMLQTGAYVIGRVAYITMRTIAFPFYDIPKWLISITSHMSDEEKEAYTKGVQDAMDEDEKYIGK